MRYGTINLHQFRKLFRAFQSHLVASIAGKEECQELPRSMAAAGRAMIASPAPESRILVKQPARAELVPHVTVEAPIL